MPFPEAWPAPCWERARIRRTGGWLLVLGDPLDPVTLDMGSTRRGRLGGAGDTPRAAGRRGGRCPLMPASRAPPVPGRYFPCRTFSSPGWRSRCWLFAQAQARGLPGYCVPGLAFQPPVPSEKREKQPPSRGEVSQGAARWEKPPLEPRSSCLHPAPWVASPALSPVPSGMTPPCRGAAGQGLPHGGARTIWEGGHVTSAGRERHVKGSARPYLVAEWLRRARLVALVPIPCQIPHPGGALAWGGNPRDDFWGECAQRADTIRRRGPRVASPRAPASFPP